MSGFRRPFGQQHEPSACRSNFFPPSGPFKDLRKPKPVKRSRLIPKPRSPSPPPRSGDESPVAEGRTSPAVVVVSPPAEHRDRKPLSPSPPRSKKWTRVTGFDSVDQAIANFFARLPHDTLERKWLAVADLIERYEVEHDVDECTQVVGTILQRAYEGAEGMVMPCDSVTASGCVALDQLLLLLRRTYPNTRDVISAVRSAIYDSVFVVSPALEDPTAVKNVDDVLEMGEKVDHYTKKTYFQGVRELCARMAHDTSSFEAEEVLREKQSTCISRIIKHWQKEFTVLLLKAWRMHREHCRVLDQHDKREEELLAKIRECEERVEAKDRTIAALEDEVQKLKTGSEMELRLEAATQRSQQLEDDLARCQAQVLEMEERRAQLDHALSTSTKVLERVGEVLRPDSFAEFRIQNGLEDLFTGRVVNEAFILHFLNKVLAVSPFKQPNGMNYILEDFRSCYTLLDPYLVLMNTIAPSVVTSEICKEGLAHEKADVLWKARQVLYFAKLLGIDLAITPQDFTNPCSTSHHITFSALLLARIANPIAFEGASRSPSSASEEDLPSPRHSPLGMAGETQRDLFESALVYAAETHSSHPWEGIPAYCFRGVKSVPFSLNSEKELSRLQLLSLDKSDFILQLAPKKGKRSRDLAPKDMVVVEKLVEATGRIQQNIKQQWQWDSLALNTAQLTINTLLDRIMSRAPREFTKVEELMYPSFCVPENIDVLDLITPRDAELLQQFLTEDYRLIRRLFAATAEGDPPVVQKNKLWNLFELSQITTLPGFDRDAFESICHRVLKNAATEELGASQWMAVVIRSAAYTFKHHPTMMLHEKVDWLFDRHLICYADIGDPSQFREAVYKSDVQAVLQDYQLQLRTIFDHYTSGKSLMSLAEFTSMLVDSGLVPTAVEKARQQIEGKLKEAVCCDIFIHLQDTSGQRVHTTANFSTFCEIIVGLAQYCYSHQPYIMLFRLVRKFVELRFIRPLSRVVVALQKMGMELLPPGKALMNTPRK